MDIYVQKDGQQQGPFPETKIRQGIDAGEFAPADLAWTTGKASWQPLSVLLDLDVTKPPPINENLSALRSVEPPPLKHLEKSADLPSFEAKPARTFDEGASSPTFNHEENVFAEQEINRENEGSSSTNASTSQIVLAPGESLLYESDSVTVTTSRLKVDDHTISLDGVTEAKFDVVYTKCKGYYGIARIAHWLMFWFFCVVLVGSLFTGGFEWWMLIFPPFFYYLGSKESREAPWNHYNDAKITLTQSGRSFVCYSKSCWVHPDRMGKNEMTGHERRRVESDLARDLEVTRAITDAISTAIASKSVRSVTQPPLSPSRALG